MKEITVHIATKTRAALVWARAAFSLRWLLGARQAQRLAVWGFNRLAKVRVAGGAWKSIREVRP